MRPLQPGECTHLRCQLHALKRRIAWYVYEWQPGKHYDRGTS